MRKIAAGTSIIAGAAYLAISGASVATERAFIMVTVMFIAVLLDRRAVSLRSVALAATIILVVRPDELTGPGFQMSFAATVALVAGFRGLSAQRWRVPKIIRNLGSVFLTSLVAGMATAPFSAAHFNMFSQYGLIANMLAVPVMGMIVMPGAVLAAVLWPLGLDWVGLEIMALGLDWILGVAAVISALPQSSRMVVTPSPFILPLFTLGALVFVGWRGWLRWVGASAALCALLLWPASQRPYILVADTGGVLGVMTASGRAISRATGDSFAVDNWLQQDGDPDLQADAAARAGAQETDRMTRIETIGGSVLLVRGKTALAQLEGCNGAEVLISNQTVEAPVPCDLYDVTRLRQTGSLAIDRDGNVTTARQISGERLWNGGASPAF